MMMNGLANPKKKKELGMSRIRCLNEYVYLGERK
jgi:hypothetical protein